MTAEPSPPPRPPEPSLTDPAPQRSNATTTDNIRGSALLTVGRLVSVGVNFLVHVVIVNYLLQAEYGAFALAWSTVSIGSSVAVFGMNKTMARFVPIYDERAEWDRLWGAILLGLGIMVALSLALIALFFALNSTVIPRLVEDELARAILLIAVFGIPLQALDSAMLGMFAIFSRPSLIFFRRHVLNPLITLGVTGWVVLTGQDVFTLALASLLAGAAGLLLYSVLLIRVLREKGLLARFSLGTIQVPAREMLGFSLPLLSTDVVFMLRGSVLVVILGALAGTTAVAAFRAVSPIAHQNMLVMDSSRLLYMPTAARLYARDDHDGIDDLYWQTAVWVAIFTLPLLFASFSLAEPVTAFLFPSYAATDAARVLSILAVGYYVNAAFGFNGLTLRVFGRVRYLVTVDVLTAVGGVAASVLLIGLYGAAGAAAGVTIIFIAQNLLYQIGLGRGTGVRAFAWHYLRIYLAIVALAVGLLAFQMLVNPPLWIGIGVAGVVSLVFLSLSRRTLRLTEMFPELQRLPVARVLFG